MQTIEMPKTRKEQLSDLDIGDSILIDNSKRNVWANAITSIHSETQKQFTIRTNRDNKEVRVWRLNDLTA